MESGIFISDASLPALISLRGQEQEELFKKAAAIRKAAISDKIYYRGLIEFSNICGNSCYYCGIRSKKNIPRYSMTLEEIMEAAEIAVDVGINSLVLQSGELLVEESREHISSIIHMLVKKFKGVVLTLSVGEHSPEALKEYFDLGAERYLLRIETTNQDLYRKIHPEDMTFENRFKTLKAIRDIGYQTGTGVMIGLPGQTPESLAKDLMFMRDFGVDMVGMGPYIPEDASSGMETDYSSEDRLNMTLNMTALLRILMPDINIVASTALQVVDPYGREKALKAGANVIMPLITPAKYRCHYSLYEGKPYA
ncbi:MAG: [FeFe] hydrogenase H-cluster radical SAM maturase HydE, partial [Elusimicrobia bacterium]|nr:[FeFe] hydrogenase H-cluster radical SAM maturase HydE [Elusimicrobiota bacterium]